MASEKIIDKDAYDAGTGTPPNEIKPGMFFMERLKLESPEDNAFAREFFVRVIANHDNDGYYTLRLQKLSDGGTDLEVEPQKINVSPDGTINPPDWTPDPDKGYLFAGANPNEDGSPVTYEQLLVPVPLLSTDVKAQPQSEQQESAPPREY
jgi:hypothetical protein